MDDRNAQVGWTEAQWNRVREEVLRAWQSVRVAGSFLPVYGGLPRSTQVVPSELFNLDGTVEERSTAPLLEIALPVSLSRQQVLEEDLSSALLQFRRRATQLGQLEDWYVFNGTYPHEIETFPGELGPTITVGTEVAQRSHRPDHSFLNALVREDRAPRAAALRSFAVPAIQLQGLRWRNPGALGLMGGARTLDEPAGGPPVLRRLVPDSTDNRGLVKAVVDAITTLERNGYVGPYSCVFGRRPFEAAHEPVGVSTTFPRDRLEPLIGRELVHASAIDVPPATFDGYRPPTAAEWEKRGVLVSVAGDPVDLAMAAEAAPEFRHVDLQGRYVFAVFERFALRIKDPDAIVPLKFR